MPGNTESTGFPRSDLDLTLVHLYVFQDFMASASSGHPIQENKSGSCYR